MENGRENSYVFAAIFWDDEAIFGKLVPNSKPLFPKYVENTKANKGWNEEWWSCYKNYGRKNETKVQ